jgi:hypothetical protein
VVLGNLCELSDKATTNILKVHKALHVQTNRPKTPNKHSVLLVGDSHIRGAAERSDLKLRSSFCTIGYVKPNEDLNNITSPMKSEIRNLSKSDVVELCGCTQDVVRNNTGCPTHYRTWHWFNNFTINDDIATKSEVDLPHCV